MADSQRNRAEVLAGKIAVAQVRDNALAPGREHFLRNLLTGRERSSRQCHLAACARDFELELAFRVGEHDEAALGAGGIDGRIHHEHEHFLEHPRRAQPAEAIEERRERPKIDDPRGVALVRLGRLVDEKGHLHAAATAQSNPVAMAERPFGNLFVVDERAAPRPAILQHEAAVVVANDLGMLARHVRADGPQIALALPSDPEHRLVDDDDARTERIIQLESRNSGGGGGGGVRHGQLGLALSTPISSRNPVKS